jgi:hypothetical protein
VNSETDIQRIEAALGSMTALGPRGLVDYLRQPTPDFSAASDPEVAALVDRILGDDPNDPPRLRFSSLIREWDNAKTPPWCSGTSRNTEGRRTRIYDLLKATPHLRARINSLIPFFHLEEPLIISEAHEDWYDPKTGLRDYYWQTYKSYLKNRKGWEEESLIGLDNTTRAVLECLSNPESNKAYSSRGLVMGYVQSGKTANFTGVIGRAADAGYRLIIVMAGTWNILRNQTQRRLDKELLGKEFLGNDESYQFPNPRDWEEFLEHGFDPLERGLYGWQRLTRPDIDFKRLKSAIDNLEFERREKGRPLYNPANLHALPVKLLVIKKNRPILKKLVNDLKLLRTKLSDLPTLIIDDESDQAGLNTIDPRLRTSDKKRTKTNEVIVELLGLFPRGQYVGYTATPYANALVDPDDPEDLFPKDFIVSLDRPRGYMGVLDFFDPETEYSDLDKTDYTQKEIAFIRRIANSPKGDNEDLEAAIRSFVLSGALKLYRQSLNPKDCHFRHHTMLIHTSSSTDSQFDLGERVRSLWDKCAFNTPSGLESLRELWRSDFEKVTRAQAPEALAPNRFDELIPYLSDAIGRIEEGAKCFIIVNYTSKDAPDFSEVPVWKIIIGGNKLSRGYTVEGLTVSYYRRVASTADTLMQMGRWFGFRQGYQDLVRVFLGTEEGKKGDIDLVALFKQVCLMEERFRSELVRYVRTPGQPRITPKQIPPLISISGQLPPTSRNKMFNAVIENRNYGGRWSQPTLIATKLDGLAKNLEILTTLLQSSELHTKVTLGGRTSSPTKSRTVSIDSWLFEVTAKDMESFLSKYHWQESKYKYPDRPVDITLQIDFLARQNHGITSWLVIAPQRKESFGKTMIVDGIGTLTAKHRKRLESGVFQNFGEPAHRIVAEYLTGLPKVEKEYLSRPTSETEDLFDPHRAVLLVYPVREAASDPLSVGFEMLYPNNDLPFMVNFTVKKQSDADKVTVRVSA